MTRKTTRDQEKKTTSRATPPQVDWINVRIDDGMVADLEERFSTEGDVAGWLLALMSETENFYLKYDAKSDAYSAGHIADDPNVPGRRCGLSGWASTPYDAIRALLYKWYVLLQQEWPEAVERTESKFR